MVLNFLACVRICRRSSRNWRAPRFGMTASWENNSTPLGLRAARLLNLSPASTLTVFHSIQGFAHQQSCEATRGCMGSLRFGAGMRLVAAIFLLLLFAFLTACGGHKPVGPSPFPAKITLNPSPSFSMQTGTTLGLTASAQNSSNTGIRPTFTYSIIPGSPAGVLDIAPNGFACAGTWNAPAYTICTPANTGVVEVTASALGATSAPTYIFV